MRAYGFEASVMACGSANLLTSGEIAVADTLEGWLSAIQMPEGFAPIALPCPEWEREGGRSIIAALESVGVAPELYRVMIKPWLLGLKYTDQSGRTWFYWQPLGDLSIRIPLKQFTTIVFNTLDNFMEAVHATQAKAIKDQKTPA